MVPARIVYRAPIVLAEFSAPWLSHPSERRSIGHDEDAAVASLGPSWSAELTQDLPIEPSAASALPRRKRLKPFKPKGFKKVALDSESWNRIEQWLRGVEELRTQVC